MEFARKSRRDFACSWAEFVLRHTTNNSFPGGTVPMNLNPNRILQTMAGAALATALLAGAQTAAPAAGASPAAAQAPAPPTTLVVT